MAEEPEVADAVQPQVNVDAISGGGGNNEGCLIKGRFMHRRSCQRRRRGSERGKGRGLLMPEAHGPLKLATVFRSVTLLGSDSCDADVGARNSFLALPMYSDDADSQAGPVFGPRPRPGPREVVSGVGLAREMGLERGVMAQEVGFLNIGFEGQDASMRGAKPLRARQQQEVEAEEVAVAVKVDGGGTYKGGTMRSMELGQGRRQR